MPPSQFAPSAKPPSGRYLSFVEREEIALLRVQGHSVREIARRLGRAASTLSRELRRDAATRGGGFDFPKDETMRVSHEAIDPSLYIQGRGALKRELTACLRTSRFTMLLHLPPMPGHGKEPRAKNGPALAGRGAEAVRHAIARAIVTLPEQLRRSLTWDQGAEMAKHADLRIATGLEIYFCDPHSPWQRGSNENTNGLLRQYFPKGTDLSVHGADERAAVAGALNGRPRKTLGWRTPAEALDQLLEAGHAEAVATTG